MHSRNQSLTPRYLGVIATTAITFITLPAKAQESAAPARPTLPASVRIDIPAHTPALRFGVATHLQRFRQGWSPDLLPMIRALGVSSIRDEDSWAGVEKTKGAYNASPVFDEAITKANTLGIEPLMILTFGNTLYGDGLDALAFSRYANWMIDHHKGKIKYFEIWNEPDNFWFRKTYGGEWNGKGTGTEDGPWVKKFADFATTVASEIKKKHPEVKLVGYSASAPSTYRLFKYRELWKNLDILAIHPYPYSVPPEITAFGGPAIKERDGVEVADDDKSLTSMLHRYREGLASVGRSDIPIWITETGYTTAQVKKKDLWLGFTESAQAMYNARLGIIAAGNGIDRTFFYDFYSDGSDPHDVEQNFGLVRHDYTPKPSYYAIQRLCTLMPGDTRPTTASISIERLWPRNPAGISDTDPTQKILTTPQSYAFAQPDGTRVFFFWQPGRIYNDAQEELANVTINAAKGEVVEVGRVVSGQKLTPKTSRTGDSITLTEVPYGSDPIYVLVR